MIDALGDKVDVCSAKCAHSAGIEIGPVNIYLYGELLWKEFLWEQFQKKNIQNIAVTITQESSWSSMNKLDQPATGLMQIIDSKWKD